jgi:hypothetical protein
VFGNATLSNKHGEQMSSDRQHNSKNADLAFPVGNSPFHVRYGRSELNVTSLDYVEVPPNPHYYREEFLDHNLKLTIEFG